MVKETLGALGAAQSIFDGCLYHMYDTVKSTAGAADKKSWSGR